MESIRVIPRMERDYFGEAIPVLYMPDVPSNPGCITRYARIGQHSDASLAHYRSTKPADPDDTAVKSLLHEYEYLGERIPLVILKRIPRRTV